MNSRLNSIPRFIPDTALFVHNCALFSTRFSDLSAMLGLNTTAQALAQWQRLPDTYRLIQTRAGGTASQPSLAVGNTCLHSRYKPEEEAARLLSSDFFKTEAAQQRCIFAGLGLGYLVLQYIKRYPDSEVVIIEPDVHTFLCFLAACPRTDFFHHRRLSLLIGAAPEEAASFFISTGWNEKTLFKHSVSIELHNQWFTSFFALLERDKTKKSINAKTLERFGSLWLKNTVKNLHMLWDAAKIDCFRNAFTHCPAVVLAGGPSLIRHIRLIKTKPQHYLIIAVDTAVRACLREGLRPDFILSFDPQYWNYLHTAGLDTGNAVLISEAAVFPAVLRQKYRAVFLAHSSVPFAQYLEQKESAACSLAAGGSVATTAWDFARYMGANPIFMVGLDLAFPHKQTHFIGSTFEESAHMCSLRVSPAETAQYRALYSAFPEYREGYTGNMVLTDRRMLLYAWWFERTLVNYPDLKTYNVMPEGIRIAGMSACDAETFFSLVDSGCLPRTAIQERLEAIVDEAYSDTFYTGRERRRAEIAEAVRQTAASAEELAERAEQAEDICRKLIEHEGSPEKNRFLHRQETLFKRLHGIDTAIRSSFAKNLVEVLFFNAENGGAPFSEPSGEPAAASIYEETQMVYRRIGRMARKVYNIMMRACCIVLLFSQFCLPAAAEKKIQLGIDRISEYRSLFAGKRVGLITNQTGINAEGVSSIKLLAREVSLTTLFSPEHGLQGYEREGALIGHTADLQTGLPVYSLYGKRKRPTPEMLKNIDILCFDIQDTGARFYTYISTMAYAMEACARLGKPFVVFDRPNPIGGTGVEGNMLELEYRSFTGYFPIVQRHGMTIGELALLFNTEYGIHCDLTVVPMTAWERKDYFDTLALIWVPPSPNIPTPATALVYVGMCIFEGTNISVGRGTAMPFHYIGAPFIDGNRLADELNALGLDGVRFLPVFFTPSLSVYAGKLCRGVYIAVTDRSRFLPVKAAIRMFYILKTLYPEHFKINNAGKKYCGLHLLTGCTQLTDPSQTEQDYFIRIEKESTAFRRLRQPYLLY